MEDAAVTASEQKCDRIAAAPGMADGLTREAAAGKESRTIVIKTLKINFVGLFLHQ
jgi:hypothetical protein